MSIQDPGSIGELITAITTVTTLLYLARQFRQNTKSELSGRWGVKRSASLGVIGAAILLASGCAGTFDPATLCKTSVNEVGDCVSMPSAVWDTIKSRPALIPNPTRAPAATETTGLGSIPGAASVTASGNARYEMPLEIPPGIAGMEPTLVVSYDSGAGNGLLGVGFKISGFSRIHRCAGRAVSLWTNDTQVGIFSSTDVKHYKFRNSHFMDEEQGYCLDGHRLVEQFDGSYRTYPDLIAKIEITETSSIIDPEEPTQFKVFRSDGTIATYGRVDGETCTHDDLNLLGCQSLIHGAGRIETWLLSRVEDRHTNYYDIRYERFGQVIDNTGYRPDYISYTGNMNATVGSPTSKIVFEYEEARPDSLEGYLNGGRFKSDSRLTTVKTYTGAGETPVLEYIFTYDDTANAVGGLSRLKTLQKCTPSTISPQSCMPPTHFTWNDKGPVAFGALEFVPMTNEFGASLNLAGPIRAADFDGDGLLDLLVTHQSYLHDPFPIPNTSNKNWVMYLGKEDHQIAHTVSVPSATNPTLASAEILTDFGSLLDTYQFYDGQPSAAGWAKSQPQGLGIRLLDYNGDGQLDFIRSVHPDHRDGNQIGSIGPPEFWEGSGPAPAPVGNNGPEGLGSPQPLTVFVYQEDPVTGDPGFAGLKTGVARAEQLYPDLQPETWINQILVAEHGTGVSQYGNGFGLAQSPFERTFLIDFNGDGLEDYVICDGPDHNRRKNGSVPPIPPSDGSTFNADDYTWRYRLRTDHPEFEPRLTFGGLNDTGVTCHDSSQQERNWMTLDFDGDGAMDIFATPNDSAIYQAIMYRASDAAAGAGFDHVEVATTNVVYVAEYHLKTGDFNGDGYTDLLRLSELDLDPALGDPPVDLFYGTGSGFRFQGSLLNIPTPNWPQPPYNTDEYAHTNVLKSWRDAKVLDWNFDGKDDLILAVLDGPNCIPNPWDTDAVPGLPLPMYAEGTQGNNFFWGTVDAEHAAELHAQRYCMPSRPASAEIHHENSNGMWKVFVTDGGMVDTGLQSGAHRLQYMNWGSSNNAVWVPYWFHTPNAFDTTFLSFDGSGRHDIIQHRDYSTASAGGGFFPESPQGKGYPGCTHVGKYRLQDFAGRSTIPCDRDGFACEISQYRNCSSEMAIARFDGSTKNLMLEVRDGLVGMDETHHLWPMRYTHRFEYSDLTDPAVYSYSGPGTATFPRYVMPRSAQPVVKSLSSDNGRIWDAGVYASVSAGNDIYQSFHYTYTDAIYDRLGRGFIGFESVEVREHVGSTPTNTVTKTSFNVDVEMDHGAAGAGYYPARGMPKSRQSDVSLQGNAIIRKKRTWDYAPNILPGANADEFTFNTSVTSVSSKIQEGTPGGFFPTKSESSGTYVADAWGNIISSTHESPGLYSAITSALYHNDPTNWLIGLRLQDQLAVTLNTQSAGGPIVSSRSRTEVTRIDPNTGAVLETRSSAPNTTAVVSTVLGRDAYGNVTSYQTAAGAMPPRIASLTHNYGPDGSFETTTENALGHTSSVSFEPAFGNLVSATNADGLTSYFSYDAFGRLAHGVSPMGVHSESNWLSRNDLSGVARVLNHVSISEGPESLAIMDRLGRVQSTLAVIDGELVRTDAVFDTDGQLSLVTNPYTYSLGEQPNFATSFLYDGAGRLVKRTNPDGSSVTTAYAVQNNAGMPNTSSVTMTNARSNSTTVYYRPDGLPVMSADANLSVSHYGFGLMGEPLWMTDAAGTTTTYTTDDVGRITSVNDPNRGVRSVTYDDFGQRATMVNATGEITTFQYDLLGRPVSRSNSDGTSTWTYDTAGGASVGKLATTTSFDGVTRLLGYDGWGNLSSSTVSFNGQIFETNYQVDGAGRLWHTKYPDPPAGPTFHTFNVYGTHGELTEVTDGSTAYFEIESRNARGQVLSERFLDGKTRTVRDFAPDTGRITSMMTTNVATSVVLQNSDIAYDANGNISHRLDFTTGQHEEFAYDKLDRLVGFAFCSVEESSCSPGTTDFGYDAIGNLAFTPEHGNYTYDSVRPQHLIATATGAAFEYDAGGNQTLRPGYSTTYNHFDWPDQIASTNGNSPINATTYHYDIDGFRFARHEQAAAGDTWIYDAGRSYRRTIRDGVREDTYRVGAVEVVIDAAGTPTKRVIHSDHVGTPEAISDHNGVELERRSYTAFGKPRDPTDWASSLSSGNTIDSPRGFSGHFIGDGMDIGLVDMLGRMYDPEFGRFTTADPYLPAPLWSQGTNRYSYVYNNPVTLRDPGGFTAQCDALNPLCAIFEFLGSGSGNRGSAGPGDEPGYTSHPKPTDESSLDHSYSDDHIKDSQRGFNPGGRPQGGPGEYERRSDLNVARINRVDMQDVHAYNDGLFMEIGPSGIFSTPHAKILEQAGRGLEAGAERLADGFLSGELGDIFIDQGDAIGKWMMGAGLDFVQVGSAIVRGETFDFSDQHAALEPVGEVQEQVMLTLDVVTGVIAVRGIVRSLPKFFAKGKGVTRPPEGPPHGRDNPQNVANGARLREQLFAQQAGLTVNQMETVLQSAAAPYKGSTVLGHALSKHAGRRPDIWGTVGGTQDTWHDQAFRHFEDIVSSPGQFSRRIDPNTGIAWMEKWHGGRGVRLQVDWKFKGFVQ